MGSQQFFLFLLHLLKHLEASKLGGAVARCCFLVKKLVRSDWCQLFLPVQHFLPKEKKLAGMFCFYQKWSGRTAGLNYGRPYVSCVLYINASEFLCWFPPLQTNCITRKSCATRSSQQVWRYLLVGDAPCVHIGLPRNQENKSYTALLNYGILIKCLVMISS